MENQLSHSDRVAWLQTLELGLAQAPHAVQIIFERAKALEALGRDEEAEAGFRDVIAREPAHFGALNDMGRILCLRNEYTEALKYFQAAVRAEPANVIGHANLAYVLLRGGDTKGAVATYERALACDSTNVEAHRGLAIALASLGRSAEAQKHEKIGVQDAPLTTLSYRGTSDAISVLLLVSTSSGNVPLERLIDTRSFLIHKLTIEAAANVRELPSHSIVINAVGDIDAAPGASAQIRAILSRTNAPVINHPDEVAKSGRVQNAYRFSAIPGVRMARIERVNRTILLEPDIESRLLGAGFAFPLLLRSVGYHTGENFVKVDTVAQMTHALKNLPGDELFVLEYLDLRNTDGNYAKFRMMLIDQMIYPLHAVISREWKVHFFSASMSEEPLHRELDQLFLNDPVLVLGQTAINQLIAVAQMLKLEYGGIDFALDADGNVIVFEANATMVVARVPQDPMWDYRRAAVDTLREAVQEMLVGKAQIQTPVKTEAPLADATVSTGNLIETVRASTLAPVTPLTPTPARML